MREGWGGGGEDGGGSRDTAQLTPYMVPQDNFFGHAIISKQLCLHSFCLFEGMHNMQIY